MKKLLLILTFAFSAFFANAQCTPDPQYTAAGIYPDSATGLLPAYVGLAHNQNITIITPATALVNFGGQMFTTTYDSMNLTNVIGLPPNFAYTCDPPNCSFAGGTIKCVELYSTINPTASNIGVYNIIFETTTYLSNVPVIGTATQNDVLDYYYLEITVPGTPSWNCNGNGVCSDPGTGNGTYASLAACQANCVALTTYVPDNNFEAYLEANGMGNGIPNDDYVTTANINTVTYLAVQGQNIASLTGIEAFTALTELECMWNQLTSLDVSQNTALTILYCYSNQLSSLNVSQNTALTELACYDNQLSSLDVSQNTALTELWCYENQLSSLDVSGATALTYLDCDYNQLTSLDVSQNTAVYMLDCNNNQITSLDVSQNTALTQLRCYDNQLSSLDVRNGNNTNFTSFFATGNPNLTCINVDNATYSTAYWTVANENIDSQSYFSNNCSGTTEIQEQTTNKELLKVTDLLGRETKATNQLLFYIYNDGTVEKKVVVE